MDPRVVAGHATQTRVAAVPATRRSAHLQTPGRARRVPTHSRRLCSLPNQGCSLRPCTVRCDGTRLPVGDSPRWGRSLIRAGALTPRAMGCLAGQGPRRWPLTALLKGSLPLPAAPVTPPDLLTAGGGGARAQPVPCSAGGGQLPALGAAARDAPLPGLAAAALPAAAPPGASALDHGKQPDANGGARVVTFGGHVTNEDDDEWADWDGVGSSGPVYHGDRPTGVDDDFGSGAGVSTGWWDADPAGTAYGRFDWTGTYPSDGGGARDAWGGFPPPSAAGPPAGKVQRRNAGTRMHSASADVREIDARRASDAASRGGPAAPPGGAPLRGDRAGFSAVFDPLVMPPPLPRPTPTKLRRGRVPPDSLMGAGVGLPLAPASFVNVPPKTDIRRPRLPQGEPPGL